MIRPGSATPSGSPPRRGDEIGAGGVADGFAGALAGANCAPDAGANCAPDAGANCAPDAAAPAGLPDVVCRRARARPTAPRTRRRQQDAGLRGEAGSQLTRSMQRLQSGPAPRWGCCHIASLSARPGLLIQPASLQWNADRQRGNGDTFLPAARPGARHVRVLQILRTVEAPSRVRRGRVRVAGRARGRRVPQTNGPDTSTQRVQK